MLRNKAFKVSIGKLASNPTVRFTIPGSGKNTTEGPKDFIAIFCSEVHDNKTTYVLEKVWNIEKQDYDYPPYVDCDYVE